METLVRDLIFTNDLEIENGDWKVSESDPQHVEHILKSDLGQVRQWALIGFGAYRLLKGVVNKQLLKQSARRNLVYDNYSVKSISIFDDLTIEPNCTRLK